jgi:hypothetical protein
MSMKKNVVMKKQKIVMGKQTNIKKNMFDIEQKQAIKKSVFDVEHVGTQNKPNNNLIKKSVFDVEQKLTQILMRGVISQITISLRKMVLSVSKQNSLSIFVSCMLISRGIKLPAVVQNIMHSISLDTALSLAIFRETGLTIVNLLSVFLIGSAFQEEDFSGSAQYIAATHIADIISLANSVDIFVAIGIYIIIQTIKGFPRVKETVSIAILSIVQNWFLKQIPTHSQLPCLFMLIYMTQPFINSSTRVVDIYNFIIMTTTSSLALNGIPHWTQAVIFYVVWLSQIDVISVTISQMVTIRLLQKVFIETMQEIFRTDVILASVMMILFLQMCLKL